MYSPNKLLQMFEIDPKNHTEEEEDLIKHTYIRDIHENGIPVHFFPNHGKIRYQFHGKNHEFDLSSLAVLDVCNRPYGGLAYNPDIPVMQISNLARMEILIPCECEGKPHLFKAKHRAASDLCELWYQAHFDYVDRLNKVSLMIKEYPFGTFEEEVVKQFGKIIYNSPLFIEPNRILLK